MGRNHPLLDAIHFKKSNSIKYSEVNLECRFPMTKTTNIFCELSWLLVVLKDFSVITVLQLISRDKLLLSWISTIPSLCSYHCYLNVVSSEINLQPLVEIISES